MHIADPREQLSCRSARRVGEVAQHQVAPSLPMASMSQNSGIKCGLLASRDQFLVTARGAVKIGYVLFVVPDFF